MRSLRVILLAVAALALAAALSIALAARILDHLLVEPDEVMNFMILARRKRPRTILG